MAASCFVGYMVRGNNEKAESEKVSRRAQNMLRCIIGHFINKNQIYELKRNHFLNPENFIQIWQLYKK